MLLILLLRNFLIFFVISGGKGIEGLGCNPAKGLIGLTLYGGIIALCGATVIGVWKDKVSGNTQLG